MFCEADRLFSEMVERGLEPNEVTYPILIHSLSKRGMMEDELHMFDGMREKGVKVTVYPYNSLINGCYKHDDLDRAMGFLDEMAEIGVTLNVASYCPVPWNSIERWMRRVAKWT
ncbi:hypothetical protein CFC21_044136 [Triticum aestivum]|uniref:Pentacotripeptide-repeat region of PRORP domain-containing protein n=2 Tax=Triticum aestivum TaxID=4565 RepID=A0A3B6FXG2_WHEAT|nr:hypothetical protein CFC21_044136 [Triticum aestivum]